MGVSYPRDFCGSKAENREVGLNLAELSIRNRVFAVMLSAAMVVFGWLGYQRLGTSQFPETDFPVVSVTVVREGASPEVMDGDVADVLEDAIGAVEGLDYLTSRSLQGTTVVTAFFRLDRDIDAAMQDVQNAVGYARRRLPQDIDPPVILKVNPTALPVVWLVLYGDLPIADISDFAEHQFKQLLETLPHVGGVRFGGLRSRNKRVWLDVEQLHAYNLSTTEVLQAVREQHAELPAGLIESRNVELNVRTMGEAYSTQQFERLVLRRDPTGSVYLENVAVVENGLEEKRGLARFNGEPCVSIGLVKAIGGNLVELCDAVRAKLPELERSLPPGLSLEIPIDYSVFVRESLDEMKMTLILGIILTALVTYFFLGSLYTTTNICLSIPISLMGTFLALALLGFTFNLMTLLALSLSVGVVVDDAILVLENIHRHRETGMAPLQAALTGAREITFAAIAATISIVAIFLPVAFLEGPVGQFFYQFGVTVSVAVLLSLVVALSLTPMLCSLGRAGHLHEQAPNMETAFQGRRATWLQSWRNFWHKYRAWFAPMPFLEWLYRRQLEWALSHRFLVLGMGGLLIALSSLMIHYRLVGTELVPSEDQSRFLVEVTCPVGSTIDFVDHTLARCESLLQHFPEVNGVLTTVAPEPGQLINQASIFVRLKPRHDRQRGQKELMVVIRQELGNVPDARIRVFDLSTQGFTARAGYPINFVLQGTTWDQTRQAMVGVIKKMEESGQFLDIHTDYQAGAPELRVNPRRDRAAEVGVSVAEIANTVATAVGGVRVAKYTERGNRYDVRVRLLANQRGSPLDIGSIRVRSTRAGLIPLHDLVDIEETTALPVIQRFKRQRAIEITANPAVGVAQGDALRAMDEILASTITSDIKVTHLGNAQAMTATLQALIFALFLGILFAYMVLGVQFNSFLHPIAVLLALPFAVTGALGTLWLTGDTLNIMSMIGLILLMGLVEKNSIILVSFTNELRAQAIPVREALVRAGPIRLRPIIMTTLATIAGAVPAALGLGPGAETRAPMARAIIGGIIVSTLITLIVVPVFYSLLETMVGNRRFGWDEDISTQESPGDSP